MIKRQTTLTGSTIYSHFRHLCPYHTWLLFNVGIQEEPLSPSDRLLIDMGISHEQEALVYFQKEYGDECVIISGKEGLSAEDNIQFRFEQTLGATEEGKSVIYHGVLKAEKKMVEGLDSIPQLLKGLRGETDFLFKTENNGERGFGGYHYEVGDAKSSRSSKFCQQMQVTFYSWLLETVQGVRPQCGRILTRPLGVEKQPIPFNEELFLIDDYIWTFKNFIEEEFAEILKKKEKDFFFHITGACESCSFYDYCMARAASSNDLSLLPDIRKIQKRQLNKTGIHDIDTLAKAEDDIFKEAAKATGVTFDGLKKLKLQAQSTVTIQPTPRGVFTSPREACLAITEYELDLPEDQDSTTSIDFSDNSLAHVYFDMESDPYLNVEYLFGIMVDEPGNKGRWKKGKAEFFVAKDLSPKAEFTAFQSFLRRMDKIRKKYGDDGYTIFHYAHYEPTHLLKLAEKYEERAAGLIDKVDYLNRRMVDLYKLIKKTYYLPVQSYSIKDVAPCIKMLMKNLGRKGGHEWKKIQTLDELKKELKKSRWPEKEIKESVDAVRQAIDSFDLADEAMIFDASAAMSIVWFNLFFQYKKRVWMKLIQIYNEDDLIATRALVDWFLFMQKGAKKRNK